MQEAGERKPAIAHASLREAASRFTDKFTGGNVRLDAVWDNFHNRRGEQTLQRQQGP